MKVPFNGQSIYARNVLSILFLLFIQTIVFGQFAEFNTGSYDDVWNDVVVDSDGNIYTVGTYNNKTYVDGIQLFNGNMFNVGKSQLMVAKYNSAGIIQWITYGISPCPTDLIGWSTGTRITLGEETGQIFIAGEHAGMKLKTLNGPTVTIDDLSSCTGSDNTSEPYIVSLDMDGNFINYTKNLRGIVTSMDVADNGVFINHLYASLYDSVDKIAFVYRVNPSTLLPSGGDHIIQTTSAGTDNIINDIKYEKGGNIYCIGNTDGSVKFGALAMNIPLPTGGVTAWAALVNNTSGNISVTAMNHAGLGGKITGEQIYTDDDFIVVAGRFSDALINPFGSAQSHTSLSSNVLKNAYMMRLNPANLISNDAIHTIETFSTQYNINNVSLTGTENNVFISISYTGRLLYFLPYSGSFIDLSSPFNSNFSSKIAVASYSILPSLNIEWFNTTYGINSTDYGYANANAVYSDLIYTVGKLRERMYFDYFPTLNSPVSSSSPSRKAMLIRNDNDWIIDGGFKSNSGKEEKDKKVLNTVDISIYPNPSSGIFFINGVTKEDKIEIFDILGKTLSFTLSFSKDKAYIEIENEIDIAIVKVNNIGYQVMINE